MKKVYAVFREVDDYPESGGGDFFECVCADAETARRKCEELAADYAAELAEYGEKVEEGYVVYNFYPYDLLGTE